MTATPMYYAFSLNLHFPIEVWTDNLHSTLATRSLQTRTIAYLVSRLVATSDLENTIISTRRSDHKVVATATLHSEQLGLQQLS